MLIKFKYIYVVLYSLAKIKYNFSTVFHRVLRYIEKPNERNIQYILVRYDSIQNYKFNKKEG